MSLMTDSLDGYNQLRPFDESSLEENVLPESFSFPLFRSFAHSDFAEKRESAASKCVAALQKIPIGNDVDYNEFLFVLEVFLCDIDEVRTAVLEQIKYVFVEFKKIPHLFYVANSKLLTLIIQSLASSIKVQTSVIDALTNLYEEDCLNQDSIMNDVIPALFDYTSDVNMGKNNAEVIFEKWFVCRVNVIAILSKIANAAFQYPKQWIYEEFLPRFSNLFMDSNPVVRKFSIQPIGVFARLFGENLTEKCLVPHLIRAIHDDNFAVRKRCCEVFVDVAQCSSAKIRFEILTPQFLYLLGDENKNVYYAAIRQIGPFIATFADPNKTGVELRDGRLMQVVDGEVVSVENDNVEKSEASANDHDSDGVKIEEEKEDGVTHHEHVKREEKEDDDRWLAPNSGLTRRLSSFTSTDNINNVGLLSGDKDDAEVIGTHLLRNGPKRGEDSESVGSDEPCFDYNIPKGFVLPSEASEKKLRSIPSSAYQQSQLERFTPRDGDVKWTGGSLFDEFDFDSKNGCFFNTPLLNLEEFDEEKYDEEFISEMNSIVKTLTNKVDVHTPSNNNVIVPPLFTNNEEGKGSDSEKSCNIISAPTSSFSKVVHRDVNIDANARCEKENELFGKRVFHGGEEAANSSFCSYWSFTSDSMQLNDGDLMNYYLKRSRLSDLKRCPTVVADDGVENRTLNLIKLCIEKETHGELEGNKDDNDKNYTNVSDDAMIGTNMSDCTSGLLDTVLSSTFFANGKNGCSFELSEHFDAAKNVSTTIIIDNNNSEELHHHVSHQHVGEHNSFTLTSTISSTGISSSVSSTTTLDTTNTNYWQKRLDLLHRSVQSVVNNGKSNALEAAVSLLPSSLRRLSLDHHVTNSNSSSTPTNVNNGSVTTGELQSFSQLSSSPSVQQQEQSISLASTSRSFIDRTILRATRSTNNGAACNGIEQLQQKKTAHNFSILNGSDKQSGEQQSASNIMNSSHASSMTIEGDDIKKAGGSGSSLLSTSPLQNSRFTVSILKECGSSSTKSHDKSVFHVNNVSTIIQDTVTNSTSFTSAGHNVQSFPPNFAPSSLQEKLDSINKSSIENDVLFIKNRFIKQSRQFLTDEEQQLLVTSKQDVIPQELLDRLNLEMLDPTNQLDANRHVAHSIPAIVYTFGSARWIFIKGLYLSLASHYQSEVRETIAHSLHEVAAIIGTTNADRDLLPVFDKFLNDNPDVQYGLLKHLYDFCKVLSLPCRESLAKKLSMFVTVDGSRAYRLRAEFAEQLIPMVRLFTAEQVNRYLSAFALTFSTDRIAEVRNSGVSILSEILALFIREEWERCANDSSDGQQKLPLTDTLLHEIRVGFCRTKNWRRRQSFGRMLDTILRKKLIIEEQFLYIFYNDLMHIAEDEVVNVRQYFCSICQISKDCNLFETDRSVSISIKSRLQSMVEEDPDLEIRHQAQIALGELNPQTAELNLRGRESQLFRASEAVYAHSQQQQRTSSVSSVTTVSTTLNNIPALNSNTTPLQQASSNFGGNVLYSTKSAVLKTASALTQPIAADSKHSSLPSTLFDDQLVTVRKAAKQPPLAVGEEEDDKLVDDEWNADDDGLSE